MSTALVPAERTSTIQTSAAADFTGELRSEWTKIRSVRSTIWALVALVVVTIGFTALFNGLTVSQWENATDTQRQMVMLDPTGQILGSGFQFSQLAICVLGVLIMTGEYSSGTIRATLLAVPRRTPVLVAKIAVTGCGSDSPDSPSNQAAPRVANPVEDEETGTAPWCPSGPTIGDPESGYSSGTDGAFAATEHEHHEQ